MFKEKDFEGAIRCYQEALDCCPTNETEDISAFHHNIAAAYENMVTVLANTIMLDYLNRLQYVLLMKKRYRVVFVFKVLFVVSWIYGEKFIIIVVKHSN